MVKHANASSVSIRAQREGTPDPAAGGRRLRPAEHRASQGYGLLGIRERVQALGGSGCSSPACTAPSSP